MAITNYLKFKAIADKQIRKWGIQDDNGNPVKVHFYRNQAGEYNPDIAGRERVKIPVGETYCAPIDYVTYNMISGNAGSAIMSAVTGDQILYIQNAGFVPQVGDCVEIQDKKFKVLKVLNDFKVQGRSPAFMLDVGLI